MIRSHSITSFYYERLCQWLAAFSGENVLDVALWLRLRAFSLCGLASHFARSFSLRKGL